MNIENKHDQLAKVISAMNLVPEEMQKLSGVNGGIEALVKWHENEIHITLVDEGQIDREEIEKRLMLDEGEIESEYEHLRGKNGKYKKPLMESALNLVNDEVIIDNTFITINEGTRIEVMKMWMEKAREIAKKTGHQMVCRTIENKEGIEASIDAPFTYALEELPNDMQIMSKPAVDEFGEDSVIMVSLTNESMANTLKINTMGRRVLIESIFDSYNQKKQGSDPAN